MMRWKESIDSHLQYSSLWDTEGQKQGEKERNEWRTRGIMETINRIRHYDLCRRDYYFFPSVIPIEWRLYTLTIVWMSIEGDTVTILSIDLWESFSSTTLQINNRVKVWNIFNWKRKNCKISYQTGSLFKEQITKDANNYREYQMVK